METPALLLQKLLFETVARSASCLHLVIGSCPMLRIDGKLVPLESETIITSEMMREVMLASLDQKEQEELGRYLVKTVVKSYGDKNRFRVGIYFQKGALSAAFYPIPNMVFPYSGFGLPKQLDRFFESRSGILVIAGPQSSGKTALAASILEEFNMNKQKRIITLEDPIEYIFAGKKCMIEQRQIGRDTPTIETGVADALREDADIVFINRQQADIGRFIRGAMDLACGNCLVIIEMLARSAVDAVERLTMPLSQDLPERAANYLVADALFAVVRLELLPRLGGGMVGAKEVMINTTAVKSLIREGKTGQAEGIIETAYREGMVPLKSSIAKLVAEGVIRREDAII